MEDLQIIELYWKRDQQAITECREKYSGYCFSVADHILNSREDSEECVNDTWFHTWNTIPPHRPKILRMFLAKITRRVAFNRFKANSAQKRGGGQVMLILEELAECLADKADVEDTIMEKELGECIRKFVRSLPVREGDVFSRRYFFTESVKEIAEEYELTENHTTVILSRTRKKLKKYLMKEGYIYEAGKTL